MSAPWPLTGRTAELERLGTLYREGGSGVVLYGPAGVGKTRLAEEALRLAERAGRRVERAVGHPATQAIPLGALAHMLPAELVRDLGVGDDERTALFHAARAELARVDSRGPLVLLVDDLDLLDDTSVAVLVPLIVARSVFVIGTVRTGRSPSPRLAVLRRDGHLVRVDLEPLAPDELGALLHRALDAPVSGKAFDELARLSGGNLQLLTELVRGARERGALVESGGVWDLTAPLPTTAVLEELVAEHLAGVDAAGLAVLELLAVCERIGLTDLERAHGAARLEALEASRLIAVVTTGRRNAVRLAHPLYGEVLRARLPPLRVRRICAELADTIEAHEARRREDVVQAALWRLASGGAVPAERLLRAARLALAGRDADLAVQLVGAVADDDASLAPGEQAEVLVEAHALQGHADDIERIVAGVWDAPLSDARRVLLTQRLADTRFSRRRDLDGALAAYEQARSRLTDPEKIAAVDARRASLLAGAGRPAEALRIVDAIPTPDDTRTRVELAAARATSLLTMGRCDEAVELSRRAAADHADLPGWVARRGISQHLMNEGRALAYSGRYVEARQLMEPAADRARRTNAMAAWLWFEMALAEIARDTGRGREAIRRFQSVADAAAAIGQDAALVWAHVGVAQGHLLIGECDAAAAALGRADEAGQSPVATSTLTRERARAWLDACRGDLAAALQRLRVVGEQARRDEIHIFEAAVLHDFVRFGAADETVDRLQALVDLVDGPLAPVYAAHARAVVDHDVVLLAEVVDRFEALDVLQFGAEAASELADLRRRRDESRLAATAAQRSTALAARAGELHTPPLARGGGIEPLTPREREVALLAAGGRTSADIGARLGLSTRTVDTHLARIYRKLGIGGRAELAGALDGAT
jgi:ATP/maltotriose-dependent transcriptional regulator MalT